MKKITRMLSMFLLVLITANPVFASQPNHVGTEHPSHVLTLQEKGNTNIGTLALNCCNNMIKVPKSTTFVEALGSHYVTLPGSNIVRECFKSRSVTHTHTVCRTCGATWGTTTRYGETKHTVNH